MKRLLFLGSTCADVILPVPHLPRQGEDLTLLRQRVALGGCAYNACSAARLHGGAELTLFSPVGGGVWGAWVRDALAARGLVSPIPPLTEENGCCYCLVDEEGERTFLCVHGAEYRFEAAWFPLLGEAPFDGAYLCGLELEEATGSILLDYFEARTPRRLYFAPGPRICHILPERMARLCRLSPVFHLNAEEALSFTRAADLETAMNRLFDLTRNDVIVTLGADGACVRTARGFAQIPSVEVEVCDTIGAGDAHIGTIMACEAQGMALTEAVRLANLTSAAVVSREGAELPVDAFRAWMRAHGEV